MALKTYPKRVKKIKKGTKVNKRHILFAELFNDGPKDVPVIAPKAVPYNLSRIVNKYCKISNFASGVYSFVAEVMATYYPNFQQQQRQNYPMITEWSPIVSNVQASAPVYTSTVAPPIVLTTPQVVTQICPYTGALVAEPVLPSMIPNPVVAEIIPVVSNTYKSLVSYSHEQFLVSPSIDICNEHSYVVDEGFPSHLITAEDVRYDDVRIDPLEFYLTLPKELFPTARMFSLDPNPIIDEFCKLVNINDNTSWILDLEFGIPKAPVTRAIPVYDVQFNSIHCKNTPGAIHPGFESCSNDFKRIFLFYYDCIISTWYKGYIIMNYDKSVKNFQSWLLLPMQVFGMCWP